MPYIQMCSEQYLKHYTKSFQCCLIILTKEESYITVKITRIHLFFVGEESIFHLPLQVLCHALQLHGIEAYPVVNLNSVAFCLETFSPCQDHSFFIPSHHQDIFISSFKDYINLLHFWATLQVEQPPPVEMNLMFLSQIQGAYLYQDTEHTLLSSSPTFFE